MIATNKTHTLVRSHDFEESEFGIDQEDISFVIDLLRNQIYSNKPLAVIREYATNAVDAHAELGKGDEPIQVTLPTQFEPTFKVRDFGTGLSDEEIKNLYTRYCKSTKRNSNAFTGQLGIGCKLDLLMVTTLVSYLTMKEPRILTMLKLTSQLKAK